MGRLPPSIVGEEAAAGAGGGQPNAEPGEGVGERVPLGRADGCREGERGESEKPEARA